MGQHRERLDGKGNPEGIAGPRLSLDARIIAVADTFDAVTCERAYRRALSEEEAVRRLREGAGSQLDPDGVEALIRVLGKGGGQGRGRGGERSPALPV